LSAQFEVISSFCNSQPFIRSHKFIIPFINVY
jgi:hypothetical protein